MRSAHAGRSGRIGPLPVWLVAVAAALLVTVGGTLIWLAGSGGDSPSAGPRPSGQGAATAGTSGSPLASAPADCSAAVVAKLSLEQQVGQLLMVGTPVGSPLNAVQTIQRYRLGGIFLAGRGTPSAASLQQAIGQLQDASKKASGLALQVAVDQEGGQVQTLKGADFPLIPSAVNQGRLDQAKLSAQTAEWAARLKNAGITIDLAPVADVVPANVGKANPPIGAFDRQYGPTADPVAEDVATVVAAMQGSQVLSTLKHFPGLGRVTVNTDTSTGARDNLTTADDASLKPFVSGIAAGTAAVMISSASYPKLDPDAVAAFSSKIVTDLLRQRLGFTGLVLSDDLGAAVAVSSVPVGQRAVRFIQAGGDVVLTVKLSDAGPMSDALLAAAKGSPEFAARVTQSATRVVQAKVRAGLVSCAG
jgi:beta-N-acetylhexosaminidase